MRVPITFLLSFLVVYASSVQESFSNQNTPYMRQLLRLAKAAEMKSFMNTSADPCSNFYEFACGNYKNINPAIALEVVSTRPYETLDKGFTRKLQKILSTQRDGKDTPEDVQVKRFYESCTRIELNTYKQQLKYLISEFGSMPVLVGDSWREEDFNWLDITGRIAHRYGISVIIKAWSFKFKTVLVVLKPPKFFLKTPFEYMVQLEQIEFILENVLYVERSLAKQTARELLDFEVNLSRKIESKVYMLRWYPPRISDLNRFLNFTYAGSQLVFVDNVMYTRDLNEVIKSVPQRIVANYIFYHLVRNFYGFIPSHSFLKSNSDCFDITRKNFPMSLENMFYRRNKKAARKIEDVFYQIKDAFTRTLDSPQLNWIQRSTKNAAYVKLQKMKLNLLSYEGVNFTQKFEGLNLTSSNYFENLRQVKMWFAVRRLPYKVTEDEDEAYALNSNTITVPVSFLQKYYFWADVYPRALMFGTMGYSIGHEVVHGFSGDDLNKWWDPLSNLNFLEREACFTEQYGHYPDIKTTDQSENIADNGGLRLALDAYKEWFKKKKKLDRKGRLQDDELLPSLNFTAKQLFFLSFAQKYCEDIDQYAAEVPSTPDDIHAPGPIRVIGSLSNLDDFSHEFNCPEGSPMNPKKKCRIY